MPGMTEDQARERFSQARVAVLATADASGHPHLVPVVFALTGDTLAFAVDHKPKRSSRLKRLENIRANRSVSLLVDAYDEDWERLWWARADGTGRVLPSAHESEEAAGYVSLLVEKYGEQYEGRPPQGAVVEITVGRWSGWRAV
ncbi:TIGR03668 family PPOX class F420-dependent oxidoreductase [Streptomyces albidus (ex Kaewkla and Franco 2022)]|uniref:TIGR03668 family PPOX class F420-dependent oxidoreductase n=1 Tax=Streptomyces albidus (ex Kaewkla and Franco 2022) TaxID=722709 RepID=UPI0015EF3BD3|nr:TIGR03668 family PPOX class F420-dependent oxidoreductase [Streptomyces albidus (ex Kaewkla and Franco 2022)]